MRLLHAWCIAVAAQLCALHSARAFSAVARPQVQTFLVRPSAQESRLDVFLSKRVDGFSRSYMASLCEAGHVLVDGKLRRKHFKLFPGQTVQVTLQPIAEPTVEPEELPLDILYEDEHLLAVNKPPGMVVHPAPGSPNGTFANAFVNYLNHSAAELLATTAGLRPGIIHRLDKGTSGVLLAAKTQKALGLLSTIFSKREMEKTYLCVCVGNPGEGTICEAIGRHPRYRQKMTVVPKADGKMAVSHVQTLAFDGKLSVCRVGIETGRTHQIRVHLQHRRTPVVGDEVYGNAGWNKDMKARFGIRRPLLHAYRLAFKHPFTGEQVEIEAPLSPDLRLIANKVSPNFVNPESGTLLRKLDDMLTPLRTSPARWYTDLGAGLDSEESDGFQMPTSEPPTDIPLW